MHGFIDRIIKQIKKTTFGIHKKIFFFNAVSCILLSIAISITVINITTRYMREQIYMNMESFTQQLSNTLDNNIFDMISTAVQLSRNKDVRAFMFNDYENDYSRNTSRIELNKYMNGVNALRKYSEIMIIPFSDDMVSISNIGIKSVDYIKKSYWYVDFVKNKNSIKKISRFYYGQDKNSYAVALKGDLNSGIILISQGVKIFDDALKNINIYSPFDAIVICDQNGYIIYSSSKKETDLLQLTENRMKNLVGESKTVLSEAVGNKKYIVTVNNSRYSGWSIVSFTSEKRIRDKLKSLNNYITLVTLAAITVVFIFSYFVSVRLSGPIRKLSKLMRIAEEKNYNLQVSQVSNDEIGELADSFNNMVRVFINNQILKREAEIRALQHQVNPHFLYNTLGLINSYANLRGVQEICTICRNMSDIFRYTVSNEQTATVRDEIEYVRKYMDIHRIKDEEQFDVEYFIDSEVYTYRMEKFILQPLVENSLTHGFKNITSGGLITLEIKIINDKIMFRISDNGEGIDEEKLSLINAYMNGEGSEDLQTNKKSIGLKNVNMRLILKYGYDSRLNISSQPGGGISMIFNIPMIDEV